MCVCVCILNNGHVYSLQHFLKELYYLWEAKHS